MIFVIGFGTPAEIYPFFSWALFSTVPNEVLRYSIYFTDHDEPKFTPVNRFLPDENLTQKEAISAYYLIQDIGKNLRENNHDQARKLSLQLERLYLPAGTEYVIVLEHSNDPITAYEGEFEIVEQLSLYPPRP